MSNFYSLSNPICISDRVSNETKNKGKEKKLSIQSLGLVARKKNYSQHNA